MAAIDGVDTRQITRLLRTKGAQKAVISTVDFDHAPLLNKARNSADMAAAIS